MGDGECVVCCGGRTRPAAGGGVACPRGHWTCGGRLELMCQRALACPAQPTRFVCHAPGVPCAHPYPRAAVVRALPRAAARRWAAAGRAARGHRRRARAAAAAAPQGQHAGALAAELRAAFAAPGGGYRDPANGDAVSSARPAATAPSSPTPSAGTRSPTTGRRRAAYVQNNRCARCGAVPALDWDLWPDWDGTFAMPVPDHAAPLGLGATVHVRRAAVRGVGRWWRSTTPWPPSATRWPSPRAAGWPASTPRTSRRVRRRRRRERAAGGRPGPPPRPLFFPFFFCLACRPSPRQSPPAQGAWGMGGEGGRRVVRTTRRGRAAGRMGSPGDASRRAATRRRVPAAAAATAAALGAAAAAPPGPGGRRAPGGATRGARPSSARGGAGRPAASRPLGRCCGTCRSASCAPTSAPPSCAAGLGTRRRGGAPRPATTCGAPSAGSSGGWRPTRRCRGCSRARGSGWRAGAAARAPPRTTARRTGRGARRTSSCARTPGAGAGARPAARAARRGAPRRHGSCSTPAPAATTRRCSCRARGRAPSASAPRWWRCTTRRRAAGRSAPTPASWRCRTPSPCCSTCRCVPTTRTAARRCSGRACGSWASRRAASPCRGRGRRLPALDDLVRGGAGRARVARAGAPRGADARLPGALDGAGARPGDAAHRQRPEPPARRGGHGRAGAHLRMHGVAGLPRCVTPLHLQAEHGTRAPAAVVTCASSRPGGTPRGLPARLRGAWGVTRPARPRRPTRAPARAPARA